MKFKELKETLENNGAVVELLDNTINVHYVRNEAVSYSLENIKNEDIKFEAHNAFFSMTLDIEDMTAIYRFMNTKPENRFDEDLYTVVIGGAGVHKQEIEDGLDLIAYSKQSADIEGMGYLDWGSKQDILHNKDFKFNKKELNKLYMNLENQGSHVVEVAKAATKKVNA